MLDGLKELQSDSQLQVAPNSRRFIKPESLAASKTPVPPRTNDKMGLAPSGKVSLHDNVRSSNQSNSLVRDIREANKLRLSKLEQFEEN